jgi:hypothetical protein
MRGVPVAAAPQIPWLVYDVASSGTVTDSTVTSDWEYNHYYKGCVIAVRRKSETGTCTLAAKLQGGFVDADGTTAFDVANADLVTFADGETGVRYVFVYPGITGAEADGVVTFDTSFNVVNGFLPHKWRVSITHGGTSVANVFSVIVYPLT